MLWTGGLTCFNCGPKRVLHNEVINVAGEMVEIGMTKRKPDEYTAEYKLQFYAQLLGHAQNRGYNPDWAYHACVVIPCRSLPSHKCGG